MGESRRIALFAAGLLIGLVLLRHGCAVRHAATAELCRQPRSGRATDRWARK